MTDHVRTFFGVPFDEQNISGPDLVALLNANGGELNKRMDIRITDASPERLVGTMPVAGNRQPFGLLHGGASAVLAESLGSVHAWLLAPAGSQPVGTELSCSHHRSATAGAVVGTSLPLHVGRTLATFEIVVRDDSDRRVCTARLSCIFLAP